MALIDQTITETHALYNGDSAEVMQTLPDGCVDFSIYSPPFAQPGGGALYHYSSSPRDLSNARTFDEFLTHYKFIVANLYRMTKPGRMTVVHCADVPTGNTGCDHLFDLPGEIIRLHEEIGFRYAARYCIWKEPLAVRNRTMTHALAHRAIVEDSCDATNAGADYLLLFRRKGENAVPVAHPFGFSDYIGERAVPKELDPYRGWKGKQTGNRYSHWIWRQYASSLWDDIRLDRVLPFREARDSEDEKHVHPLQLDVIDRAVAMWSNPGEVVFTPFMGVGSEVYGAVCAGRRGVGCELKSSYYRQAVKNLATARAGGVEEKQVAMSFDVDAPNTDEIETDEAPAPATPPAKAKRSRKTAPTAGAE